MGVDKPAGAVTALRTQVSRLHDAYQRLDALRTALAEAEAAKSLHAQTEAYAVSVLGAQNALRDALDALEEVTGASVWPLPKYRELLAPPT